MYRAFGLLEPDNDFNLDVAAQRLKAKFPGYNVARAGDQVTLSKGDWEIALALVSGPHVATETVGITDKLAGFEPAEAELLAASGRRVEVWSDVPDPFMEHFSDYFAVIEVL